MPSHGHARRAAAKTIAATWFVVFGAIPHIRARVDAVEDKYQQLSVDGRPLDALKLREANARVLWIDTGKAAAWPRPRPWRFARDTRTN